MDREITSSSLSDLLSLLLVPASSAWRDRACPDHNYALTYLPANHKKPQPSTLPLCPAPPLTSHLLHLRSHSPFIPPYNPNLSFPLKHSALCFHTLFDVLICFAHMKTEEKSFSLFFLILSLFFYILHWAFKLYLILSYIFLYCLYFYPIMAMWVDPPLWSRQKCLNNYWMDCHEVWCRHSWCPEDESYWLWWSWLFLTFVVLSEMSRQRLDGLSWNLVQTFMFPSWWLVISLIILRLSI